MIKDRHGNIHTLPQDIRNIFVTHLTQKYRPIDVDDTNITIMKDAIPQTSPTLYAEQLDRPITYDEILTALREGARHKTPGIDGLGLEFYTANWNTRRGKRTRAL